MPSPIDFTDLWKSLPYVENIPYVWKNTNGDEIHLTIPAVVLTPRGRVEQQPSAGKYIKYRTTFKIPKECWEEAVTTANSLGKYPYPQVNDEITIDGKTWTIAIEIDATRNQSLYRLEAIYLKIKDEFCDTCKLHSAVNSVNAYGDKVITHVPSDDLKVAIQPINYEITDFIAKRGYKQHFRIYLETKQTIPYGSIIIDSLGVKYWILTQNNADTNSELPYLEAVITP